jgi:hypothetical protein
MKLSKSGAGQKAIYDSYGSTHVILAGKPENPPLLMFHGAWDNSP